MMVVVVAAIVTAVYYYKFYGKKPKRVFWTTCGIVTAIEFVVGLIFIGKPMTPNRVPLENVAKAEFVTESYTKGFLSGEITTSPTLITEDMHYVQQVYATMDDVAYTYTLKEYVNEFGIGGCRTMTLFDDEGHKLTEIAFYGDEVVSIKNGLFTHYYDVSGELDQYTMVDPFADYEEYQKQQANHE